MKIGAYTVTPENEVCCKCKKNNCKGDCKEFRAYIKAEQAKKKERRKFHKKQQN